MTSERHCIYNFEAVRIIYVYARLPLKGVSWNVILGRTWISGKNIGFCAQTPKHILLLPETWKGHKSDLFERHDIRLFVRITAAATGFPLKFIPENFMKICRDIPNLVKTGSKHRDLYITLHVILLLATINYRKSVRILLVRITPSMLHTHLSPTLYSARTHTYTHKHTYPRAHTHKHTYRHLHTYTYIYTHTHTHIHKHTYTYIYTHTYTHRHTHTHTYTHTHTSAFNPWTSKKF
jgi:hypothetical protein